MRRNFPNSIETFKCYTDGGRTAEVYSGPVDDPGADYAFYSDGHPYVESMEIATYKLVHVERVPCNRDPERIASWGERNGREELDSGPMGAQRQGS